MNRELYETLAACGFRAEFFGGHGLHDWEYWDRCVRTFIERIRDGRI